MATNKLGTSGVLKLEEAGSPNTSYDVIIQVRNVSFSVSGDEVEVTNNDSTDAFKEFLMGNRTGTMSFTCLADALYTGGDTRMLAIVDEMYANYGGGAFRWQYFPAGTTNEYYRYTFSGFVKEITQDVSNNEVSEVTVTLQLTSSIVVAAANAIAT